MPARRIAFLLSGLRFGGGERVALNLAAAFQEQGYEIDILLLQCVGELLGEASARFNIVDLRCARTWQLPWALARYLRRRRPDALISSFWKLNLCAALARIAAPHTKLALWEHSPPSRSANSPSWLYGISASLLYRLATRIFTVSDGVADDVRRITRGLESRIVTIYNAVPPPASSHVSRHGRSRRVLWVGRLDDPKNPMLMVEAMARVPASLDARLFILGDGPHRERIEARLRERGLRGRIRLLGFQKEPYRFMARADLLVLSSDREGLPTVLIEGLHAGLPLVSTDCAPGVREILLDGELGTIVPVRDAEALAAAIVQRSTSPSLPARQRDGARRFEPAAVASRFAAELGLPLG